MALPLTPLGLAIQAHLGTSARQRLVDAGVASQAVISRLTTDPVRSDRAEALRQLAEQLGVAPEALLSGLAQHVDGHWQTFAVQLLSIADALDVGVQELLPVRPSAVVVGDTGRRIPPSPRAE